MSDTWQLQEAKNKLSQLVKQARAGHPQTISVHGREAAVLLSLQDYQRLRAQQGKLSDALLMPEIAGEDDVFERVKDSARAVEL